MRKLILALMTGAVLLAGCDAPITTHHYIFVDQSASVGEEQRRKWTHALDNVIQSVKPGDRFLVFGIHDNSRTAAPLLDARLTYWDDGSPFEVIENGRRELREFRLAAADIIRKALVCCDADGTDILGALDRIKLQPDCLTNVVVVSDMLNCSNVLNLEHGLQEGDIPRVIRLVAAHCAWDNHTLEGVSLHVLLPDVPPGKRSMGPDSRVLREFWVGLTTTLGGQVATFDTHM